MTPAFLAPAGLAALAALAIPFIIHLRRRTEQVPVDFAALRWLRQRPRPRQRIRFDDWPLLLVRLLLLALAAMLLARPVLYDAASKAPRILVVPGAEPPRIPEGSRAHWLAPGFPPIDQSAPPGPIALSSLLRQFDAELPAKAPLAVYVPAELHGVDAERPRLSRAVRWEIVPGRMMASRPPAQIRPALSIRHDGAADNGIRYVRAAAQAWVSPGKPADLDIALDSRLPDTKRVLVWLRQGPVPAPVRDWIGRGGTALLGAEAGFAMPGGTTGVWRDASGTPLVEAGAIGRGRVLRFVRPLVPARMPELLEPDFPERLQAVLTPAGPAPARVLARAFVPRTGAASYPQPPLDLWPWLALAVALIFLVERWLASSRKRVIAA